MKGKVSEDGVGVVGLDVEWRAVGWWMDLLVAGVGEWICACRGGDG